MYVVEYKGQYLKRLGWEDYLRVGWQKMRFWDSDIRVYNLVIRETEIEEGEDGEHLSLVRSNLFLGMYVHDNGSHSSFSAS